jgi:hypothetical protein
MRAHVGSLSSELLALNSESSLREGGDPPKAADTATGKDLQAVIADFSERFKARTGSNPVWNDRKHIPGVRRILRALKGLTAVLAYSAWFFETDDRFVAEEAKWSPDAFVSSSVVNKWLARNVGQRKSIRDEWKDERAGFLDTSKL